MLSMPMSPLTAPQFVALLAQADVSQAAFARLTGVSARQVNKWCRGRAAVPQWAGVLAVLLEHHSAEEIAMMVDETSRDIFDSEADNTSDCTARSLVVRRTEKSALRRRMVNS